MTINTHVVSACSKIRAYTVKNSDDPYTIFINDNAGYEERQRAYQHEMKHIENKDFENYNVQKIEYESHNKLKRLNRLCVLMNTNIRRKEGYIWKITRNIVNTVEKL